MNELAKLKRELRIHRAVLTFGAIAFLIAANAPKTQFIDVEEIHADKLVAKKAEIAHAEMQNSVSRRFYAVDSAKTIRGFFGVDEKGSRPETTDTTALVMFDEEGVCHAQMYARHDVAAIHLMRGDSMHAPPVITLQCNRKAAQGDWIELVNSRRQILSKVQNETATFEVKNLLDNAEIGFSIEKIGHPKSISVDR